MTEELLASFRIWTFLFDEADGEFSLALCQILNQHLEQARLGFESVPFKGIILCFEGKVEKKS